MTRLEKEFDSIIGSVLMGYSNKKPDTSYPPYNIVRIDETNSVLELALAGFTEAELEVQLNDDKLKIAGKKTEPEEPINYIYKGIGARAFERTFNLSPNAHIVNATYSDGILSVFIQYEIPEEKKPKQIKIDRPSDKQYLTE